MAALLFVLLLAVPVAELWVIVQVAQGIGVLNTLAFLILVSMAGAWLLKREGLATWRRLQEALARGEMPTTQVTDGALILFGGALLLTPGFITDAVGLLLVLPPTRAVLKRVFRRSMRNAIKRRTGFATGVYEARVTRSRRDGPSRPPDDRTRELDEGDSPDRG